MKNLSYAFSIVFCIALLLLLSFFQYTVPKKYGEKNFPALEKNVEVYYDDFGIPHINAQTDLDGYRVLGFIAASERLFQLDLMKRVVNGRLSEIFGEKTIESDKLLRKLRLREIAEEHRSYIESDPKNQQVISFAKAYLEGIHHYIDTQPLPLEFILLNYVPDKFTLNDILGVPGYMALTFAEGIIGDIFLSEMMDKLPEEKMRVLRGGANIDLKYFNESLIPEENTTVLKEMKKAVDTLGEIVPLFYGSNSWVLSGKRTESGFPILANDPHIGTGAPHIFFEAHLKTPSLEVYGNYIPLIPFPVMGHTAHNAWGITMSMVDDVNIYLEKINPQNSMQVMYKNEWVDLEVDQEVIKVKGQEDIQIEKLKSPHGPIIDDTRFGIEGKTLSINWSVHHPESNILRSLYEISQAENVGEFRAAISMAAAPGLNMSWVNKGGDIVWWMLGKNPKLPENVASDLVLKGWDGSSEVERYYTVDENAHEINPSSGVIVSANYIPMNEKFSYMDGYWQPGGRFFRLSSLLKDREKWRVEELKHLQTDTIVPVFDSVVNEVVKALSVEDLSSFEKEVLEVLQKWDGSTSRESVGSSIYHKLNFYLISNAFRDEFEDEGFEAFGRTADFWHSYKRLILDLNHSFWDDVNTNRVEDGKEIVLKSFKEAVKDLKEEMGSRIDLWNWGKIHTVEHEHILGKVKPLNYLYNVGPVAADGGRYVINNQAHRKALNDFRVVHAPATRRLIDMKNTKKTLGILPSGNSGNPFSEHYRDQIEIFQAGEYRDQLMDWDVIEGFDKLIFMSEAN